MWCLSIFALVAVEVSFYSYVLFDKRSVDVSKEGAAAYFKVAESGMKMNM